MFKLCEDLLDWIEVWAVGREKQEPCPFGPNGGADRWLLVAGKVVHYDDVAWFKRWAELLLDPSGKAGGIDGLIEYEGSVDPVAAQGSDEGHRLPVTVGRMGMKPLANRRPPTQRGHVGFGPGLIDKNQLRRLN